MTIDPSTCCNNDLIMIDILHFYFVVAPSKAILRDLMLVSKILQTVANGVLFGKKEAYLLVLNEFVERYQNRLLDFFEKLGVCLLFLLLLFKFKIFYSLGTS